MLECPKSYLSRGGVNTLPSNGFYGNYKNNRRIGAVRGFLIAFLWNLLMKFGWSIPAWVFLAVHYLFGLPLWLFWFALGIWLGYVLVLTIVIAWANRCSNGPSESNPNKNPYSITDNDIFLRKKK